MNIVRDIIGICIVGAIVFLFIGYQIMDKRRYMALTFLNKMDRDLRLWLAEAAPMFSFDFIDSTHVERYRALVEEYNSIKNRKAFMRVKVVNEASQLFCVITCKYFENMNIEKTACRLTQRYDAMANHAGRYNYYADKLNEALKNRIMGLVGKIFRMKPLDILSSLSPPLTRQWF